MGNRTAIDQALGRLTKFGTIRRLSRGLYDYSEKHPTLGYLPANKDLPDLKKDNHAVVYAAKLHKEFVFIHPFVDGNGRVSRLLTLLVLYQHGFTVGKYISLERVVEQSKETYYETLNKSSQKWHEAKHNVMPWFNYFLGTVTCGL